MNNQNETFKRHPVLAFFFLGLGTISFGLLLIWLPFIGIPLILIGAVCVLISILFLVLKIIVGIKIYAKKGHSGQS